MYKILSVFLLSASTLYTGWGKEIEADTLKTRQVNLDEVVVESFKQEKACDWLLSPPLR